MNTSGAARSRRGRARTLGVLGVLGLLVVVFAGWWAREDAPSPSPASSVQRDAAPRPAAAPGRAVAQDAPIVARSWGRGRGQVCGVVRDAAAGSPVAGAAVSLSISQVMGDGRLAPGTARPVAITAEDGTWAIAGVRTGGAVNISVAADGFTPARASLVGTPACTRRAPVDLTPGGVVLSGVVRDGLGGTVAGAAVEVKHFAADDTPLFARAPLVATSDDAGRFRVSVRPGEQIVSVGAEGYAASEQRVRAAPGAFVEIHLLPAGRIEGRVVDADSDAAVAGAAVDVTAADGVRVVGAGGDAITDPDGRFVVEGVPPGRHHVHASRGARGTAEAVMVALGLGEVADDVELRLSSGLFVRGRVLDTAGRPVAGALAQAVGTAGMAVAEPSDPEGRYFLGPLSPGAHILSVTRKGSASPDLAVSTVQLRDAPIDDHDLVITTRTSVRGHVEPGSETTVVRMTAVAGGGDRAGGEGLGNGFVRAQCDARGDFELPEVIPGDVRIVAEDPELGEASAQVRVPPEGLDDVTLTLASTAGVRVRVTDGEGRPVAGAALTFTTDGAQPELRAGVMARGQTLRTDGEGRASSALMSPGPATLSATRGGAPLTITSGARVELSPGWQALEVVVDANLAGVEVQAVRPDGSPREGVVVSAVTGAGTRSSLTEDDGLVRFEDVGAPGSALAVDLVDPLGGVSTQRAATAGERLVVVMPQGHRLVVDVTGFGGGYVELANEAGRQRRDYAAAQERVVLRGLVAGAYAVRVVGAAGYGEVTATVPGQEAVQAPPTPWAQVHGRVLNADDTPAAGLPVIMEGPGGRSPDTELNSVLGMGGITTDAQGRFVVPRCFAGPTTPSFVGDGVYYRASTITLEAGERRVLPDFLVPASAE